MKRKIKKKSLRCMTSVTIDVNVNKRPVKPFFLNFISGFVTIVHYIKTDRGLKTIRFFLAASCCKLQLSRCSYLSCN